MGPQEGGRKSERAATPPREAEQVDAKTKRSAGAADQTTFGIRAQFVVIECAIASSWPAVCHYVGKWDVEGAERFSLSYVLSCTT
jgi:hypothetical protein